MAATCTWRASGTRSAARARQPPKNGMLSTACRCITLNPCYTGVRTHGLLICCRQVGMLTLHGALTSAKSTVCMSMVHHCSFPGVAFFPDAHSVLDLGQAMLCTTMLLLHHVAQQYTVKHGMTAAWVCMQIRHRVMPFHVLMPSVMLTVMQGHAAGPQCAAARVRQPWAGGEGCAAVHLHAGEGPCH